jgi:hypothetical protein
MEKTFLGEVPVNFLGFNTSRPICNPQIRALAINHGIDKILCNYYMFLKIISYYGIC